jgi:ABC-type multidrug transport system fused ATPase/permease subunit
MLNEANANLKNFCSQVLDTRETVVISQLDGQIIQVGNFTELLQQEGLFARLVARQME